MGYGEESDAKIGDGAVLDMSQGRCMWRALSWTDARYYSISRQTDPLRGLGRAIARHLFFPYFNCLSSHWKGTERAGTLQAIATHGRYFFGVMGRSAMTLPRPRTRVNGKENQF